MTPADHGSHGSDNSDGSGEFAGSNKAATVPPTLDELPNLKPLTERTIAAKVEVEGAERIAKRRLVPDYKELPLSPEEKKALGKDKPELPDDFLSFYKPEPRPEHGGSPLPSDLSIGIGNPGGMQIGLTNPRASAMAFGTGGVQVGNNGVRRDGAGTYVTPDVRWDIGLPWSMRIGHGPARTGQARMPYLDR